jgi:hypothetical protein
VIRSTGREQVAVATSRQREERDVHEAHDQERNPEEDAMRTECVGNNQRSDEHRGDRNQHRPTHDSLVRIDGVRQPRVARPCPPECGEDQQAVAEPAPRRVVRHQRRDLREREHEDQVEEQLERRHAVLVLGVLVAHSRTLPRR